MKWMFTSYFYTFGLNITASLLSADLCKALCLKQNVRTVIMMEICNHMGNLFTGLESSLYWWSYFIEPLEYLGWKRPLRLLSSTVQIRSMEFVVEFSPTSQY